MYTSPNPIFFFFNMKTTKIIVVLNIGNRIKLNQSENNKNKKTKKKKQKQTHSCCKNRIWLNTIY